MKVGSILGLAALCCLFVWFFFRNPNRPERPAGSKPESFYMRPRGK